MAACTRYRVLAERTDLAADEEVASWAKGALQRAALLDEQSPCYVHVRVTAGPIRAGGRQDGWVAHVAVSTRRYLRDGKLVADEKGMLLVESTKEALAAKARSFVEDTVAALGKRREERPPTPAGEAG
jgi:lactam utilization protein B